MPREIVTKWVVGYTCPIKAPIPSRDETGSMMPEYCAAGSKVTMAVPKIAATWLRVNDDIKSPIAVAEMT